MADAKHRWDLLQPIDIPCDGMQRAASRHSKGSGGLVALLAEPNTSRGFTIKDPHG
jgi:hypothetical protein